ncbi:hypothetical protein C8R43DRAFT_942801 [Mycena crocata]|nr:hypothetical protein C8R43DRAFT_942801 [Mycena crocata]
MSRCGREQAAVAMALRCKLAHSSRALVSGLRRIGFNLAAWFMRVVVTLRRDQWAESITLLRLKGNADAAEAVEDELPYRVRDKQRSFHLASFPPRHATAAAPVTKLALTTSQAWEHLRQPLYDASRAAGIMGSLPLSQLLTDPKLLKSTEKFIKATGRLA